MNPDIRTLDLNLLKTLDALLDERSVRELHIDYRSPSLL